MLRDPPPLSLRRLPKLRGLHQAGFILCVATEDHLPLTYNPLSPSQEGQQAQIPPGESFHPLATT